MKRYVILLLLTGCNQVEYSNVLIEEGEVYDTAFVPAGHGHGTNITPDLMVESVVVNIPEQYAVMFKCQHGKFAIVGENGKRLYHKLDRGDKVYIKYREKIAILRVDGKTVKEIIDFDFLDATKRGPAER